MRTFLAGLGTGAAIGVLLAPNRGSETRRQLASKAGDLGDVAAKQLNRVKQAVGDPQKLITQVKDRAQSYADEVTDVASSAGETVKSAAQSLASKAGVGPLVMLNTASHDDLMSVHGIGPVLAEKIISGRPYMSEREVVERDIIPESTFKELRRSLRSA
jgi:DNA uptake protein ComE-like DNA-binding protein